MARFSKGISVLGLAVSVLISAQLCSAQLWVYGYSEDDDHIGWAVGTENSNCKVSNAAETDYFRKGGTRKGLYRFPAPQQPCGPDIYGCYALVRGVNRYDRKVYSFVSAGGILTEKDAIDLAIRNAILTVPSPPENTISVIVSGCERGPSTTKPTGQDPGGLVAIKGRILENLRRNIRVGSYDDEVSSMNYSKLSVQLQDESILIKYRVKVEIEDGSEESETAIKFPLSSLRSMAFRTSEFERFKEKGLGYLVTGIMECTTRIIDSSGSGETLRCDGTNLPYDPGPGNQNFNELRSLIMQLTK